MCALAWFEDSAEVFGVGDAVHDAVRDLSLTTSLNTAFG